MERFMREALKEALNALNKGEVPVGAVVVEGEKIIGRGHNRSIELSDPTAHAEIIALREASRLKNNYRLNGVQLFVTVEPCLMCVGACIHARITKIVFGTRDPKAGCIRSHLRALDNLKWNHHIEVIEGILSDECSDIIKRFFKDKRKRHQCTKNY